MAKSFATVKAEAVVIRDETVTNANTATRVGTAMLDTLDTSEEAINTVSNQKVNISDIVDSLSSVETSKPLSANQGKVLSDKKVDKTRNVIAGNGLTGGGALSSDITMNVAATNDSIVIAADSIKVDTIDSLSNTSTTKPLSANQGKVLNDAKVAKTQSVNAGNGLTGGGALSGNVTLNVVAGNDSIVVAADSIKVDTVDTLVSTSTTKPLSAKQGKVLNDALGELDADIRLYKDLQVVFSIDANMNLLVNIPDPVNDEFSLNSNGELILTY